MNKSRLLMALVAIDVLLAFASVGAEMFFRWTLPPLLADYARHRFSRLPAAGEMLQLAVLVTCVFTAFASWIGLLSFWRLARPLYLVACAMGMLLVLVSGPTVLTSVGAMIRVLNGMVAGVIIGLIYFSDLAQRFEPGSVERTAPTGANLGTGRA